MSIHCKEGVYSKQYCLWNWLLLEMVELVNRILSMQLTDVENKTFKVKDINKTRKLIYTWIMLQ